MRSTSGKNVIVFDKARSTEEIVIQSEESGIDSTRNGDSFQEEKNRRIDIDEEHA